ncbi:MAG: hypothetical protein RIQ52_733 [Pseudomonadota bacterium]|jgi:phospholipid transport system transporter-binding protein
MNTASRPATELTQGRDRIRLLKGRPGWYRLQGMLTFATAADALRMTRGWLRPKASIQLDLSGIEHTDSAGIALLLEWLRQAELVGATINYYHFPLQLETLIEVNGVDTLIRPAAATAGYWE